MTEQSGYVREICPHCGVPVWHHISRFDPESWTEANFLKEYRIDEQTKQVAQITPEPRIEDFLTSDELKSLADEMERRLIYGDGSDIEPIGIINAFRS